MSIITAFIILVAFFIWIAFQAIKNFQLRSLNISLNRKDYGTVEQLADMATSRRFLGDYTCDLYKLRARYMSQDLPAFEQMLKQMIATTYKNPADYRSFLEQYYHTFLLKGKRSYAQWLLDGIRSIGDTSLTRYNEQAFSVLMDGCTDLIASMIDQINQKHYYGFALGVILFMIAAQYEAIQDFTNAVIYYQNAKVCFHPNAVYTPVIERKLAALGNTEQTQKSVSA